MVHPSTTIAFFARGREIGYVRLAHGQLVRYGVKTIKGGRHEPTFTQRVDRALSSVLDTADAPAVIVFERGRARPPLGALGYTINVLSKRWKGQGFRVHFLSVEDVKQEICGNPHATHRILSETIVQRYPLLWPLMNHTTVQRAKYWANVCLALALADGGAREAERPSRRVDRESER